MKIIITIIKNKIMAKWDVLKTAIASAIKTNGNQEITGSVLQNTLNTIVNSVGANATFAGIATPTTNPGTPDGNVFYIAQEKGAYPNFGGVNLLIGEFAIIYNEGTDWNIEGIKLPTIQASQMIGTGQLTYGKTFEGISPNSIYRVYTSCMDKEMLPGESQTFIGLVAIDETGNRKALGDIVNRGDGSLQPYYDYFIPSISNVKLQLATRLKTGYSSIISLQNVTSLKKAYCFSKGTVQISNGNFVDSENRARAFMPISNSVGFKRIIFDIPNNFIISGTNVYGYEDGAFVKIFNGTVQANSIDFMSDGSVNQIMIVIKKSNDAEVLENELLTAKAYSDLDINQIQDTPAEMQVRIEFERGQFNSEGIPLGGTTLPTRFSGSIQRLFLTFTKEDRIVSDIPQDCTIYCYGADFNFLSTTKYKDSIHSLTRYIKLSSNSPIYNLTLSIVSNKELEFVKNGIYINDQYPRYKSVSYEMKLPHEGDVSATLEYQGNEEFVWNNGYIILPTNYKAKGEPVPLIIFCHGTGGYEWAQSEIVSYGDYIRFLAKNGYAVAGCSSVTSKYATQRDIDVPNKISLSCYATLYKYLVHNFNVKTDGVYLFGKSAGGMNSALLSSLKPFPVKAVAGFAPSLDFYSNMRYIAAESDVNWAFQQLGIPINVTGYRPLLTVSQGDKEVLMANIHKTAGFNPIWTFNDFDINAYYNTALSTGLFDLENNSELLSIISSGFKVQPAPMKIWHAVDDDAVPIATSRFYKQMVNNAGGICYIREFPANCGKHHAVDNDQNAPVVDYLCKNGETISIPVAYAEMLDWFNQFLIA